MAKVKVEEMVIDGTTYVPKDSLKPVKLGKEVIIRTYSAGVHVGNLEEEWTKADQVVTLKNARRIWRWRGANTLNEVAVRGVNRSEYTRISETVSEIKLSPIEVIPIADGVDLSEVWNG